VLDHAASYRALKNGNIKNFLSVTPVMKDINSLKSAFDTRSQKNLRRMKDYLLQGDTKSYKYFLKNQTELENLWKTMTGDQSSLGKIRVTATGPHKGKIKIYDYGSTSLLDKNKNLLDELADNLSIRKNIVNASSTKNLDEARRIMLEGSKYAEKKLTGALKLTDKRPVTTITKSFQRLDKPEMFKAEKQISKLLSNYWCGTKQSVAGGGRIGFSGSCPDAVKKKNFLRMTNDVANGKITGEAAEQIAKNAAKVVTKAGGKSALARLLGPTGIGLDIAYEVGSIGFDMAMDSNVSLKGALQNNWLTGAFIEGTGQEEYHKGLTKFDSSAKPYATAIDLMDKIQSEEKNLERIKTNLVRGDYTGWAKKEIIAKQEEVIKNLYNDFNKVSRKVDAGAAGQHGDRYLTLEGGSKEKIAYDQAKQEYDSIGAARTSQGQDRGIDITSSIDQTMVPEKQYSKAKGPTLLKRKSKHGFKESLKSSRAEPWIDFGLLKNPQYGKFSKRELDKRLKQFGDYAGYGWTPYGHDFGMQQMKPGIGDKKYNKDLGYRELSEMIAKSEATDRIAQAGGVSKMAQGGIMNLKKKW
jgi:hypothetical protein